VIRKDVSAFFTFHAELASPANQLTFEAMTGRFKVAFTFLCIGVLPLAEAQPRPLHETNSSPPSAAVTNAPLKQVSENVFELGKVRLDKNEKSIRFPATVNMREGNVEYLLVHSTGKVHESILKTDAEPFHIHTAMLLLGAKSGVVKTVSPQKKTSEVGGDQTGVYIFWKTNGVEKTVRGEELILNSRQKAAMSRGPWSYNGSRLINGNFLAQRDGSIVSAIADPDALVNNPRPERDNDEIWLANTNSIPPVNTAVEVEIKLEAK